METERADPGSILHLYRRLLVARRGSEALSLGALSLLETPTGTLGWRRHAPTGDERVVLVNMSPVSTEIDADGIVEVASDGRGEGARFDGALAPDAAVILRPG